MPQFLRRCLAPPSYEGDGETLRHVELLNTILNGSILFVSLLIVGMFIGGAASAMIPLIDASIVAMFVLIRYWLFSGRLHLATVSYTLVGLLGTTVVNGLLGTIRTPSAALYLFWILVAGALFRLKGLMLAVLTSSVAIAALILAENKGWLPIPNYSVGLTQWVAYTGLFVLSAALTYHSSELTRRALTQAEREVLQRKQTEVELIAAKNRLKGTLDALPDILFEIDAQGVVLDYRSSSADLLMVPPDVHAPEVFRVSV